MAILKAIFIFYIVLFSIIYDRIIKVSSNDGGKIWKTILEFKMIYFHS